MLQAVAFIGVGHIAKYMITGLKKVNSEIKLQLYAPSLKKNDHLSIEKNIECCESAAQAIVGAQLIIIATKPDDVSVALKGLVFSPEQTVLSVAAGVSLEVINKLVAPAKAARAMPISCVAVNKSPTLLFPDDVYAKEFLNLLGNVHLLDSEQQFNPATALVGAYYAWLFPMMDKLNNWAVGQGLDEQTARQMLIEINQGACAMASVAEQDSFENIWQSLATEGGISARGMQTIEKLGGISAWCAALDDVTGYMNAK